MLTPDEIRERLRDRKLKAVAEATGLHPNTVYAFVRGETMPTYDTLRVLSEYLTPKEAA